MTKRQREALKLAMEYLKRAERDAYGDWDIARQQKNEYTPAQLAKIQQRYFDVVAALQTIEEMLRGVQGELKI